MELPGKARLRGGLLLVVGLCTLGGVLSAVAGCVTAATPGPPVAATHREGGLVLSPKPLYGKFVWHDLVTENPAAVKRFYTQLLGWEFQDVKGGKRPYSLIKAGGRFIGGIVQPTGVGKGGYSQWLGYLSVPDVDRAVSQVSAGGGKALVGPEDVQNIGRAAVVADPQGAPVGFVRSEPGDPSDIMGLPQAGQILWMEYLADDPVAAVNFYKGLLGYAVEERKQSGGLYYVLKEGEHPRAGVLRKPVERVRPNWLTYVRVDDPAAVAARAEELGGRVVMAPRPDVRGGSLALIADPSGAVLALQRFPFEDTGAPAASK